MGISFTWSGSTDLVAEAVKGVLDEIGVVVKKAIDEAADEVSEELFDLYKTKATETFEESMQKFYDAYSPKYYGRSYSLKNLLDITNAGDGYVTLDFDPSKMSGYRSGYSGEDGLYDLVFRRGFHGGAESGSYKGSGFYAHPNPGVPYWRKPYPSYKYWGSPAAQSTPPKDIFDADLLQLEAEIEPIATQMFLDKCANIKIEL